MIKKLLTFCLIVLTLFSNSAIAAEEEALSSAASLMISLGIMESGFSGDEPVTRGELAEYGINFFNMKGYEAAIDTNFLDLPASHPYYSSIKKAYSAGMIEASYTDFFSPDSTASLYDVSRVLLVGLSYRPLMKSIGETEVNYIKRATDLGILKGSGSAITKNSVAIMLYNTLSVAPMNISGVDSYSRDDKTVMQRLNIHKGTGQITANEFSHIVNPDKPVGKGFVLINDNFMVKTGGTAASSLLGFRVTYFYYDDGEDIPYLLSVTADMSDTFTMTAHEIKDFSKETATFSYERNERQLSAKISKTADIIFNGVALNNYTKEHLMPEAGSVTLYRTGSESAYDLVLVTSYVNYFVGAASDLTLFDSYGKPKISLKTLLDDSYTIISSDGAPMTFDKIAKNDVVSVMASRETITNGQHLVDTVNSKLYTLVVTKKSKTGEITETFMENNRETVVIGGEPYKLSKSLETEIKKNNAHALKVLDSGKFFLDMDGFIAGYDLSASGSWKYGFILKTIFAENISGNAKVKLLSEDGKIDSYDLSDKVRIDGSPTTLDPAKIINLQHILVKYKKNSIDLITDIDTENLAPGETIETSLTAYSAASIWAVYNWTSIFSVGTDGLAAFAVNSTTKIFYVPAGGYSDDETLYSVKNNSSISDGLAYEIKPYDMGDNNTAKAIVHYAPAIPSVDYASGVAMVSRLSKVMDSEGNLVDKITCYSKGNEISLTTGTAPVVIRDFIRPGLIEAATTPLSVGDIIRIQKDYGGRVVGIDRMYGAKSPTRRAFGQICLDGGDSGYRRQFLTYLAKIYNVESGAVSISLSNDVITTNSLISLNYSPDFRVTCYDSENSTVSVVSINELIKYRYTQDYASASKVFVHMSYGQASDLFLIK